MWKGWLGGPNAARHAWRTGQVAKLAILRLLDAAAAAAVNDLDPKRGAAAV